MGRSSTICTATDASLGRHPRASGPRGPGGRDAVLRRGDGAFGFYETAAAGGGAVHPRGVSLVLWVLRGERGGCGGWVAAAARVAGCAGAGGRNFGDGMAVAVSAAGAGCDA